MSEPAGQVLGKALPDTTLSLGFEWIVQPGLPLRAAKIGAAAKPLGHEHRAFVSE